MTASGDKTPRTTPRRPRRPATARGQAPGTREAQALEGLLALRQPQPHAILGTHPAGDNLVVRAYRPDAATLTASLGGGRARRMTKVHPAGVFEARFPQDAPIEPARLRVRWADGTVFSFRDPFAFLPTLGELDLHLFAEGRHEELHHRLGARPLRVGEVEGFAFAVWAPNAEGVSVVGDFNGWDHRLHQMRMLGSSGVWELFIPELEAGAHYKFELRDAAGQAMLRSDPFARATEVPPGTASILHRSRFRFADEDWREKQMRSDPLRRPLSIYEVHLGSWRHARAQGEAPRYRELAEELADYVVELGFTHVELLPITEHPFHGSWGYQVTGYFAPTARLGDPDDFRFLVDHLHRRGIGVILDWVPAHFPKDIFALARFDGTALYEHQNPLLGEHPDWGTLIFNYGRAEVRNFLLSSALFWLEELHLDGLRLDAVASMLYRDYGREGGAWLPNAFGGRENLEAVQFLTQLNEVTHQRLPGVLMIAEESTAWPGVSRPTYTGGLGFGFKWNMGWMHDTLKYFSNDPVHRRFHHGNLTFGLLYAWSEHFILPLSHDEVVHGKGSLINKMPGDRWQKFANLRALFGHMWAHPGRKLLFMGGEFGQWREWNHDAALDWHLVQEEDHRGLQTLVADLNRLYRQFPALWESDSEPAGFAWIDAGNAGDNVVAFRRRAASSDDELIVVGNFSPVVRGGYRIGLPRAGTYAEVLNTDAGHYGGSNVGNLGGIQAEAHPWHGLPWSARITLPPLAVMWFRAPPAP